MVSDLTAEEVKAMRAKMGLTQEQLAVTMGVQLRTVARWEAKGRVPQSSATLMKLLTTMAMKKTMGEDA